MSTQTLPPTSRALVQHIYAEPLTVEQVPTPQPTPGSAIIKILSVGVVSYTRDVLNGNRKYPYPTPFTPGTSAIGRVAALGPDAVLLTVGQLVYIDCVIRGRDDSNAIILSGITEGGSEGSRKLMRGEWRNSTYAEYAKFPLENVHVLDEGRLSRELGYGVGQLTYLARGLVPYGGFKAINLQAGETVIIAPATGGFGGAAVAVALAMGARVIAMGRNVEALGRLKQLGDRVETVQMLGDVEKEMVALKKFGKIDAFFDISPPAAQNSTHIKSCILSLKTEGKVSLMGGLLEDVPIPHRFIMRENISLIGKWMYYRHDIPAYIKMVETGLVKLDNINVAGEYPLEHWKEAFDKAAENEAYGEIVVMAP
jgi:D-arabinose 1-dehydrogenase-like Zn-dependent alcohol dehydrogenase